jgi:hypothetical protein
MVYFKSLNGSLKKCRMTKILIGILVISLVAVCSCTKSPDPGGSWTFQGGTYYVTGCNAGAGGTLSASNVNNNNANTYSYGTIGLNFYQSLPTAAGTFAVVKYPPAANQVAITTVNQYQVNYVSTGGNGMETVKVSIGSNGLVNVSGSGIEMLNASGGDSAALSFDITQTQ